jgi:hypothetical protein
MDIMISLFLGFCCFAAGAMVGVLTERMEVDSDNLN